ncbi:MAG TPA: nuclear transport factor 2 family protein [Burkholderiaceae bacterium]|nr:nuclear transport factor 2 family protein [Burkholderiaceae bacterium]
MRSMGSLVALATCAALGACASLQPAAGSASDLRDLTALATCYVDGIDAIGVGKVDAGSERWRQCFSDELKFSLSFGSTFSMTCPGEKCPFPPTMNGFARRVALAKGTFERAGYVATSHHITSLGIEQSAPDAATVRGHLQAWHLRKDGATVVGLGTWQVQARKTPSGWRIVEEQLESPLRVVMPKAE